MSLADKVKIDVRIAAPGEPSVLEAFRKLSASVDQITEAVFKVGLRDIAKRTACSFEDLQEAAREIRNHNPALSDKDVLRVLQSISVQPKLPKEEIQSLARHMADVARAAVEDVHIPTALWSCACGYVPKHEHKCGYEKLENKCKCGCADLERGERWSHYSVARYPKPDDVVRWTYQGLRFRGHVVGCRIERTLGRNQTTVDIIEEGGLAFCSPAGGRWTFGDPDHHNDISLLEYLEKRTTTMAKIKLNPGDRVQWAYLGNNFAGIVETVDSRGADLTDVSRAVIRQTEPVPAGPRNWVFGDDFSYDLRMLHPDPEPAQRMWNKYSALRAPHPGDVVRFCTAPVPGLPVTTEEVQITSFQPTSGATGKRVKDGLPWSFTTEYLYSDKVAFRGGDPLTAPTFTDPPYAPAARIGYALAAAGAGGEVRVCMDHGVGSFIAKRDLKPGVTVTIMRDYTPLKETPVKVTMPAIALGVGEPRRVVIREPAPHKCALAWCATQTTAVAFCSTNCEHTSHKIDTTYKRLDDFLNRIGKRPQEAGMAGEVSWAKERTSDEIAGIKSAWTALRHQPTEGNEAVWPVCDDGDD